MLSAPGEKWQASSLVASGIHSSRRSSSGKAPRRARPEPRPPRPRPYPYGVTVNVAVFERTVLRSGITQGPKICGITWIPYVPGARTSYP